MLIPICILLAASPVSASLLPQSSSIHLLDIAAVPAAEGPATQNAPAPKGVRIAAEAVVGIVGGLGLGMGGAFLGAAIEGPSSSLGVGLPSLGMLHGLLIGYEAGEMLGVAIAGFGLGAKGSGWGIVLGNLVGVVATLLVGLLPGGILGPVGAIFVLGAPVAGEIIGLEMLSGDQAAPDPSTPVSHSVGQTAALTIHF